MSTYSLTLRQRKGRRLSISEVDNNWLYLKELAEMGSTSSGSSSDFPSRKYAVEYNGYLIDDVASVGVLELISGSFAVGDIVTGSPSNASGEIVYILHSDVKILFLYLNNIVGTFASVNEEDIINNTQIGFGLGIVFPNNLSLGDSAILKVSENSFTPSEIVTATGSEILGITSMFVISSTTASVNQYDLIVQSDDNAQFRALGALSVNPEVISTTYSTGINSSDNLFGQGSKGTGTFIQNDENGEISFNGVFDLSQPGFIDDRKIPGFFNFTGDVVNYGFFSKSSTILSISQGNNNNCSSTITMDPSSVRLENISSNCCGNLRTSVNLCGGNIWWQSEYTCFILPTLVPNCCACNPPLVALNTCGNKICLGWGSTSTIDGLTINSCTTTVGYCAGNVSACESVFIGSNAGASSYGCSNTFVGHISGYINVGCYNTFLGAASGNNSCSGCYNTFIGYGSGVNNNSGCDNIMIGSGSGNNSISGSCNIFIGNGSGYSNNNGSDNIFIGECSGFCSCDTSSNVFLGSCAGLENICNSNTFIGNGSGRSSIYTQNSVFIGSNAGLQSCGDNNVLIGMNSGIYNNGCFNTYLGYQSGYFCCGNICNSIALGACAQPEMSGDIAIGSNSSPVNIGSTAFDGGVLTTVTNYLCVMINGTRYKLALFE